LRIVLDSNVLVRDFLLKSTGIKTLIGFYQNLGYELFVPQIVIDEVCNKYMELLKEDYDSFHSKLDGINQKFLIDKIDFKSIKSKIDKAISEYRAYLTTELRHANVTILPIPEISHEKILERELMRKKPFRKGGYGYRDYLIWLTVVELAKQVGFDVAFISENSKDFSDLAGNLHQDLIDDLLPCQFHNPKVIYYKNIAEFIDEKIKPTLVELSGLREQILNNECDFLDIDKWLEKFVKVNLTEYRLRSAIDNLNLPFSEATVTHIEDITKFKLNEIYKLTPALAVVSGEVEIECSYDFFIDKNDYYTEYHDSDIGIEDEDWNDWTIWASDTRKFTMGFGMIVNLDSKEIESENVDYFDFVDKNFK
jgi:predicted nucleic acid-binding protein